MNYLKYLGVILMLVGTNLFTYSQSQKAGFVKGIDFLFDACYNVGEGHIIDEPTGRLLYCRNDGVLTPDQKGQLPLDKDKQHWYNNA